MKCSIAIFVALCVFGAVLASDWQCTPKVPYKENECNGCFCSENHLLGCTEMACPSTKYQELFNCVVGTRSKNGCNECVCVKGLGTICTDHKC